MEKFLEKKVNHFIAAFFGKNVTKLQARTGTNIIKNA
jgi:hypothetical protein